MKKDILVIGASGFAKEVLFSFENYIDRFVFFDNINEDINPFFDSFSLLKSINEINTQEIKYFILGFGGSQFRETIAQKFTKLKLTHLSIIASTSKIGKFSTQIGHGTLVMDNVLISNNITIGEGCLINKGVIISHDATVGDFCDISPSANIMGWAQIGNHVEVGANSIILPGIKVGDFSIIGAGSVVTKDVLEKTVVVGNPAKILRTIK